MVGGIDKIAKIDAQIENSKSKSKSFGSLIAQRTLQTKTPAQWWSLMVMIIQNNKGLLFEFDCSSSGCERN